MTDEKKQIKRALVSVYHKDELLEEIIKTLHNEGVQMVSTGGTHTFIESLGVPCETAESLTGYPSILGGRVKTLHPKIFGGILARREQEDDLRQLSEYDIPAIDLVIVDLYPFKDTVAAGASEAEVIEKIDIGGISLILYGMIASVGVRNIVETNVDFSQSRNVIVAALILVLSIGINYSSAGALNFTLGGISIKFSGIATGSLVGILLNAVLPGKDYKFDDDVPNRTGVNLEIAQGKSLDWRASDGVEGQDTVIS